MSDSPVEIIERLRDLNVTEQNYYRIRSWEPEDPIDMAIRFLYLNRTAFGGIYRLNQEGKFNVPYGGGERTPEPLWSKYLIQNASKVLQGVELIVSDFENVISRAKSGDVVYCDPTYTTVHNNGGFVRYNERNFSWNDQKRLAASALKACERGAFVLVSNASYRDLYPLYYPFKPKILKRKSLVSRNPKGRREVNECLFILDPNII